MCGRFVANIPADELKQIFSLIEAQQLEARFNVAPAWRLEDSGSVWLKIRTHSNH